MIKCLLGGIRQASRSWKMILLLLVANILFAIPLAVPVFLLITETAGGTLFTQRLNGENLDAIWVIDLINEQFVNASPVSIALQVIVMLALLGSMYVLFNTLLVGGI